MPTSLNPELVKGRLLRLTLTRLQIQKHQSQQSEEAVPSALSPDCDPGHRKAPGLRLAEIAGGHWTTVITALNRWRRRVIGLDFRGSVDVPSPVRRLAAAPAGWRLHRRLAGGALAGASVDPWDLYRSVGRLPRTGRARLLCLGVVSF